MAPVSTLKINNHIPLSCTFCTWDSLLLLTIYCMNTHDVYIKKDYCTTGQLDVIVRERFQEV